MQFFYSLRKWVFTFVNLVVKPLLLLPLIVGMVWFNYTIDRSGLFQGDRYERKVALALLEGESLTGYEQMDERQINALYVQNMEGSLDTAAIGSSRILQLSDDIAGSGDYYNFGMVGADFKDMLGTYYLFEKEDKLPENLILGLDPWLLSASPEAEDYRSDKELYNEFLTVSLHIETNYEPADEGILLEALFSPSYFQGNVEYYFRDQSLEKKPSVLTGNLYDQVTEVKLADGTVFYAKEFREADEETVETRALAQAASYSHITDFTELDPDLCRLFDQFIEYVQGHGVNVIFVLTPHHSIVYDFLVENADDYRGFFIAEPWYTQYALAHDIPIYGSYNPYVSGTYDSEFYDGLHIKPEGLRAIFPGMQQVLTAQESGMAGSPWITGGPRVSPEMAYSIAMRQSGVALPHVLARGEDEIINGAPCYTFIRYGNESYSGSKLAIYAVSQDDGFFYRLDTSNNTWVHDARF